MASNEELGRYFDEVFYLQRYPDVAEAVASGSFASGLEHFLRSGLIEGRDPNTLFDSAFYLQQNPDVAIAGMHPWEHFVDYGIAEGRAPSALFDPEYYAEQNPDVVAAGMSSWHHFVQHGEGEGRDPSVFFDTGYYLTLNPDVAAAGVDPFSHYITYGQFEGRDPSTFFDTDFYLSQNPDVSAAGIGAYEHFMEFGLYELRDPSSGVDLSALLSANTAFADGVAQLDQHLLLEIITGTGSTSSSSGGGAGGSSGGGGAVASATNMTVSGGVGDNVISGDSGNDVLYGSFDVYNYAPTSVSGNKIWLDGSDTSSLYQDSAGTVAVTANSDPVGRWSDKSGEANHAFQSVDNARRPVYETDLLNGRPGVHFTSDYVETTYSFNAPYSIIFLAQLDGTLNQRVLEGSSINSFIGFKGISRDDVYLGAHVFNSVVPTDTDPHLYSLTRDGAKATTFFEGGSAVALTAETAGSTNFGMLSLGGYRLGEYSNVRVLEVLVWDEVIASADRQQVEYYLSSKWATPWSGSDNDTLTGGTGADTLIGGLGADDMRLGPSDTAADYVYYQTSIDGAAAGANTGYDEISQFELNRDKVAFGQDFNGGGADLDDIAADDTFAFQTNAAVNFTTTHEGLVFTGGLTDANLTEANFTTIAGFLNVVGITAAAGDDGLIIVQGATKSGIYLYVEDGTAANDVSASELTLLGTVDALITSADVEFF